MGVDLYVLEYYPNDSYESISEELYAIDSIKSRNPSPEMEELLEQHKYKKIDQINGYVISIESLLKIAPSINNEKDITLYSEIFYMIKQELHYINKDKLIIIIFN